jgi:hypothetical protein
VLRRNGRRHLRASAVQAMADLKAQKREAEKAATLFARLRLSASPQFFTLLRQSVIAKVAYAIRVHHPNVSRTLCQKFDMDVEQLVTYWASVGPLTEKQRLIMSAPRGLGGFGLTRMEYIAKAAHYASTVAAEDLGATRRELVTAPTDIARSAAGELLDVVDAEHAVDESAYAGPQAGGSIAPTADGGGPSRVDNLLPREQDAVRRFFK